MHFTWPAWDKTQSRLALFANLFCVVSVLRKFETSARLEFVVLSCGLRGTRTKNHAQQKQQHHRHHHHYHDQHHHQHHCHHQHHRNHHHHRHHHRELYRSVDRIEVLRIEGLGFLEADRQTL